MRDANLMNRIDEHDVGCRLSAVQVIARTWIDRIREAKVAALVAVVDAVQRVLPDLEPWLLVTHSAPRWDNRITRYYKIWKSLERSDVAIPAGERMGETTVKVERGLQFTSALRCRGIDAGEMIDFLNAHNGCVLLFIAKASARDIVASFMATGWRKVRHSAPPLDMLRAACQADMLACEHIGRFDDRENGIGIIGRHELTQACYEGRLT